METSIDSKQSNLLKSFNEMRFCCESGGVYDFFNDKNLPNAIYPEIIGYYLTYVSYLKSLNYEISTRILAHIAKTIDLLGDIIDDQGIPVKIYENESVKKYYAFDQAMIGNGLLSYYEKFGDVNAKKLAQEIYIKLVKNFFENEHLNFAVITDLSKEKNWSHHKGQYHLKLLLFFHKAGECLDMGEVNIYQSLRKQILEEFTYKDLLVNEKNRKGYHLHPFCYGVEGLLYDYYMNKNHSEKDRLERVIKKLFSHQFPLRYVEDGVHNNTVRNDITTQLLRIYKLSNEILGDIGIDLKTIELLKDILNEYELECGSFSFGQCSEGSKLRHPNSWVTFMSHQTKLINSNTLNESLRYLI